MPPVKTKHLTLTLTRAVHIREASIQLAINEARVMTAVVSTMVASTVATTVGTSIATSITTQTTTRLASSLTTNAGSMGSGTASGSSTGPGVKGPSASGPQGGNLMGLISHVQFMSTISAGDLGVPMETRAMGNELSWANLKFEPFWDWNTTKELVLCTNITGNETHCLKNNATTTTATKGAQKGNLSQPETGGGPTHLRRNSRPTETIIVRRTLLQAPCPMSAHFSPLGSVHS